MVRIGFGVLLMGKQSNVKIYRIKGEANHIL